MSKEKAIALLRDAHKHREHAEKLERIAHRQLDDADHDEHLGLHDEHEVRASASSAVHDGHRLSTVAALHRGLASYNNFVASHYAGRGFKDGRAEEHASKAANHKRLAGEFNKKAETAMRPHLNATERNAVHAAAETKVHRRLGNAQTNPRAFDSHTAHRIISKYAK